MTFNTSLHSFALLFMLPIRWTIKHQTVNVLRSPKPTFFAKWTQMQAMAKELTESATEMSGTAKG